MCFNAGTSLAAFAFGATCSAIMLHKYYQDRRPYILVFGVLLFFVSCMQLIEYVLWRHPACGSVNRVASLAIIGVLALQPLSKILLSLWLFRDTMTLRNKRLARGLLVLLLGTMTAWFLRARATPRLCSRKDSSSCRLQWAPMSVLFERVHPAIVLACFAAYFLGISIAWGGEAANSPSYSLLFGVGTLMLALMIAYVHKRGLFYTIFGSMWCFLAVSIGVIGVWEAYR